MSPEQYEEDLAMLELMPTICGLCKTRTTYGETVIHSEPILYTNEDGSPRPVYYGMPTVREFRICKTH